MHSDTHSLGYCSTKIIRNYCCFQTSTQLCLETVRHPQESLNTSFSLAMKRKYCTNYFGGLLKLKYNCKQEKKFICTHSHRVKNLIVGSAKTPLTSDTTSCNSAVHYQPVIRPKKSKWIHDIVTAQGKETLQRNSC